MPDSLDDIYVLPKMHSIKERGRIFRLLWVMDLVSDSFRSYVTLVFQNTDTNFILLDTVPPELLSYCALGSYFSEGKKLHYRPGGKQLTFTIKSSNENKFVEAGEAFTDEEFDLSLNGKIPTYSDICRRQLCFVQQLGPLKVVIPCFVIAGTYYFKSTSLREAILSRRMDSLFRTCTLDENARHAVIDLKPGGNISDAVSITRFEWDSFAKSKLYLCKDHHFAQRETSYRRLKADFPVEQDLTITARGISSTNEDGTKTFIVQSILDENSHFPFDSIDILYEKDEGGGAPEPGTYFKERKGHRGAFNMQPPFLGNIRHLLESCTPISNKNADNIVQNKIPVSRKPTDDEKSAGIMHDKDKTDLSTQPPAPGDGSTSKAEIREEVDKSPKTEWPLESFIQMVLPLCNSSYKVKTAEGEVNAKIENFRIMKSLVHRRYPDSPYLTQKESYDNSASNRRQCAYVRFTFNGRYVCLVEVDQLNTPNGGCSTRVLVSDHEIYQSLAEACIRDYVEEETLSSRIRTLKADGISLKTIIHPHENDEKTMDRWRLRLLGRILKK